MEVYLTDLYWAQEWAARNRAVMMALFQQVVTEAFINRGRNVEYGPQTSAHHHYAQETLSDGTELIVTRSA